MPKADPLVNGKYTKGNFVPPCLSGEFFFQIRVHPRYPRANIHSPLIYCHCQLILPAVKGVLPLSRL